MLSYPTILDLQSIQSIKPQFGLLMLIDKASAINSQTCVLAGEQKQIHLITTNNDPEGFKKIVDNL